jgi:GntR family transcriptional regulator
VVLRHSRRAVNGAKVVEVSRSVYRADRFTLWVQLGQDG